MAGKSRFGDEEKLFILRELLVGGVLFWTEELRACQEKRTQCYGMQAVFSWRSGLNPILSGMILLITLSQNIARSVCLKFKL